MNVLKNCLVFSLALSLFSCTKDRLIPASTTPIPEPSVDASIINYWNFNTTASLLSPSTTHTTASLEYKGAKYDDVDDGSTLNAQNGDVAGNALRLRNPSGDFIIHMSTAGYSKVTMSYVAKRTSSGPQIQHISYTTDGVNYSNTGLSDSVFSITEDYKLISLDFSGLANVDDNAKFAVKVSFTGNTDGDSGNDRIDNLLFMGITSNDTTPTPPSMPVTSTYQYWNFNNKSDLATPTLGDGTWSYGGDGFDDVDGTVLNAQNGDTAGSALRLRNPSGDFVLSLPTTGYSANVLTMAVQRSSKGAATMLVSYSIDGTNFITTDLADTAKSFDVPTEDDTEVNLGFKVITIDFSKITTIDNNKNFKVKITPSEATSKGNFRIDNIRLQGQK